MAVKSEAPQVVGLGQCALDFLGEIDRYPGIDQKTELLSSTVHGGGPVATALVALQRLGVDTAIVGRVGDDEFGDRIRQGLHDEGVDCRNLQTIAGKVSQHAFITVERGSGRRNIFWHRGSCPPLPPEDVDRNLIRSSRLLHLDGLQLEASIIAAGIARSEGVVTVLDGGTLRPGVERLLPLVDHAVVSERFAEALTDGNGLEPALERLMGFGVQAATVTLGERGSVTLTRCGSRLVQKPFAALAVDTTGCGDVFQPRRLHLRPAAGMAAGAHPRICRRLRRPQDASSRRPHGHRLLFGGGGVHRRAGLKPLATFGQRELKEGI